MNTQYTEYNGTELKNTGHFSNIFVFLISCPSMNEISTTKLVSVH